MAVEAAGRQRRDCCGLVAAQRGRFAEALEAVGGRLPYAEAVAHEALGWVFGDTGRTGRAVASFEEALRLAQQVENRTCQVDSLVGMANVHLGRTASTAPRRGSKPLARPPGGRTSASSA
ncbi:tetratricopeptide repeat protein [Streptomyces sp. HNM0645]|uniref:tetratricopeptide repeat protein n=1 Tax=Streptomyces sp. HNM0645 TaxID=2782343 RepID=UPI0024B6B6D3|nr:tetratricopeptide repeat protein [Streptomyces sp. HNM0645]MDI9883477.1 tetratricopeptide repeat protein [Streptomyces sp. HNM0645]